MQTLTLVIALSVFGLVSYFAHNYYAVPASVPGPFLAKITDFWRAYKQYTGQLREELLKLHAKHGPIVRYGIKSVSIIDPKAIEVIYSARVGYTIAHSYDVLVGISNGKEVASLVSTRDEVRHGHLRKSVANVFSAHRAQDYEPAVDATIQDLMNVFERNKDKEVDISKTLAFYSMDSAFRMTFTESLGCLRTDSDVDNSIQLVRGRFEHWGHWSSIPWLERLVFRNPWAMRKSVGKSPSKFISTVRQLIQKRVSEKELENGDLLSKFIEAHNANPDILDMPGVVGLTMSTISGAGDTTLTIVASALYYLMKSDSSKLQRLREELSKAGVTGEATPAYSTTSSLPYLSAVIKESLRIAPVQNWPGERLVPTGPGLNVNGKQIPPGTSVGIFTPALHQDKELYGEDADRFRPERWLEADEQSLKRMEHTFMGFSRGRRACIGQNIALMQMKKLIPAILMRYDLELVNKEHVLGGDYSSAVLVLDPIMVRLSPRRSA